MAEKKVDGLVPNTSYPPDWVEMKHPQVEQAAWFAPSAVSHWESRGWKTVGATKTAPAADTKGA